MFYTELQWKQCLHGDNKYTHTHAKEIHITRSLIMFYSVSIQVIYHHDPDITLCPIVLLESYSQQSIFKFLKALLQYVNQMMPYHIIYVKAHSHYTFIVIISSIYNIIIKLHLYVRMHIHT